METIHHSRHCGTHSCETEMKWFVWGHTSDQGKSWEQNLGHWSLRHQPLSCTASFVNEHLPGTSQGLVRSIPMKCCATMEIFYTGDKNVEIFFDYTSSGFLCLPQTLTLCYKQNEFWETSHPSWVSSLPCHLTKTKREWLQSPESAPQFRTLVLSNTHSLQSSHSNFHLAFFLLAKLQHDITSHSSH